MEPANTAPGGPATELSYIEKVVFLQSVLLFRFCDAEQVLRIASIAHQRFFAAGERIYAANDPPDAIYCVVWGAVEIDRPRSGTERLGPLATFGLLEIFSDRLHTDSATAVEDTLVLAIEAEDFFDLLAHNIEIIKALFRRFLQEFQPIREDPLPQ